MDFKTWLYNSESVQLKKSTKDRYIKALEKVGERMGLNLPNILQIKNHDEFLNIKKTIKENPKYDEINKSPKYGNGDLNAALGKFEEYFKYTTVIDVEPQLLISTTKLQQVLTKYKTYFPKHWEDEKYKWEAVKHFQNHWNIEADDFGAMFKEATEKTQNLLASGYTYPRTMINNFANVDTEATREMFRHLFDENIDLVERIAHFKNAAENLQAKYDDGTWKSHHQTTNAISTYLWLRFPDKYYIYKYEYYEKVGKLLTKTYKPKRDGTAETVINGYKLYDEICKFIKKDEEMKLLLHNSLTESCYPDPEFKTVTTDFGHYVSRYYEEEELGEEHIKEQGEGQTTVLCRFETGYRCDYERNRIIFGAPGTGKSYKLNQNAEELVGKDNETDCERVTFHPDYSYAHFVGTYKPVPYIDKEGRNLITYEYVPGPFMRIYVNALKNSRTDNIRPFLLIIEEINRANAAAVFGDVFQLLDRNDNNVSAYPIQASNDIKRYLAKELNGKPEDFNRLCIPDNMFIWATMNSADQGVFPVDTAFKRRWEFTYLGIDDSDTDIRGKYVLLGSKKSQKVEWNQLRKAINHFLAQEKINEDKQLGPYFIARKIVVPEKGNEIDRDKFLQTFKNKVLMYLFEDAAKQKRAKLFSGCSASNLRYSEICREFDEKGIEIFNQDIKLKTEAENIVIKPD